MKESAEEGKRVARGEAREGEGDMRDGIIVIPSADGNTYTLAGTDWKTVFHEWGTGRHGTRPGVSHRQTSWVYFSDEYGYVTTTGVTPKPMLRPGLDAGIEEFYRQKRKRGL